MAKPILILTIYSPETIDVKGITKIQESVKKQTENEYHVLIVYRLGTEDIKVDCLNDHKGLKDIDIEKLINEYHETKST